MAKAKAKQKTKLEKLQEAAQRLQEIANSVKDFSFEQFQDLMSYLRLNDEQDKISLTNLAVMLMLYKIYQAPVLSVADLTALFVAVSNYAHKRHVNK